MNLRYRKATNGHTVIDYAHPHTRAFIRAQLRRIGEPGRLPHATEWRAECPDPLPEELNRVRKVMGFADLPDMARWAGLQLARRRRHNWERRAAEVGAWIDERVEAEERALAEADTGAGLPVCETPRTVMAFDARRRVHREVTVWVVR